MGEPQHRVLVDGEAPACASEPRARLAGVSGAGLAPRAPEQRVLVDGEVPACGLGPRTECEGRAGDRRRRRVAGSLVLAGLFACGPSAGSKDMAEEAGANGVAAGSKDMAEDAGSKRQATTCDAAGEVLDGTAWVPGDARLALVIDLADPGLDAAVTTAAAEAPERGLPVVAGMALTQLGLQLTLIRSQLTRAGLAPRELALVHDRGGAPIWVLRARCDLRDLQAALARAWGVRGRAVAGGEVAEAIAGSGFPLDVVFLAEDRVALVPAGQAMAVRRWFEAPASPLPAGPSAPRPGEVLAEIPPAPIRGVLTGTSLLTGDPGRSGLEGREASSRPLVRTLRVRGEVFEIDGEGRGSGP
jgi:hypothetical protein